MDNSVLKNTINTDEGDFRRLDSIDRNEPKNQTKKLDYNVGKHFDIKTKVIHLEVDKKGKVGLEVGLTVDQVKFPKLKRQKQTIDVYNFDEEEKKRFIPLSKVQVKVSKTQKVENPYSSIKKFKFYPIGKFVLDDPISKCHLAFYESSWNDAKDIDAFCITTYENLRKEGKPPITMTLEEKILNALRYLNVPDFNASHIRYDVARIMNKRIYHGKIQYFVDWALVWLPFNIVRRFYRSKLNEYQHGKIVSAPAKKQRDTYEDNEFCTLSPRDRLIMKRESAIVLEQAAKELQARDNHNKKMRK